MTIACKPRNFRSSLLSNGAGTYARHRITFASNDGGQDPVPFTFNLKPSKKKIAHKGTEIELKSGSVKANLSFVAPTDLYERSILALAEEIKLKRALVTENA